MATIRHRVGTTASPAQVYDALTTIPGLAKWWTTEVDGDPTLGGSIRFFFGSPDPSAIMEVTEATPEKLVAWQCIAGPDDWRDNPITFEIKTEGDETVLLFTHFWREPVEFMYHCSTKWGYFLLSLKSSLEGEKATPFPADRALSAWG